MFQLPNNPTASDRHRGWVYITRTIFFGNYCVNFFIYSLSGACFRRHLKRCMSCGQTADGQEDTTNRRGMDTQLRRMVISRASGQNPQMIATTTGQVI